MRQLHKDAFIHVDYMLGTLSKLGFAGSGWDQLNMWEKLYTVAASQLKSDSGKKMRTGSLKGASAQGTAK